jgi:hypothetical protein
MDQRFYKTADGQSGLFFTALGAFVVWQASTYSIGTVAKMGPGYFPLVLGILLTIVGLAVTFKSIRTSQEAAARFEWRSAIAITAAIVLSGLLLLTAGLVVAVPALVIVSSFAAREQRWSTVLWTALALTAGAYLIFIVGLGLRIPLYWG